MRSIRIISACICAAAAAMSLIGCHQTDRPISNSNETMMTTQYPMTIEDSFGNVVTIESEPLRVISVGPSITENMYAIGAGSKLVGRTDYCDFPEDALLVDSIGALDSPDVEKIVGLEPDLVIASSIFTEESYTKLTDLGITVLILHNEYDVSGVYNTLDTLGAVLNVSDKATEVSEAMQASIAETQDMIAGREAPSVYYVVGYGEYGDYTAGGDTFVGTLLSMAGGANIAQDVSGWSYSLESLIEADPDIILLPFGMKDSFVMTENYKDLSAVTNNRVYEMDRNLLERQGYRNAEGIRTLAQFFYPDAFTGQ
jgi:iron complex transport system substrate-binding protein